MRTEDYHLFHVLGITPESFTRNCVCKSFLLLWGPRIACASLLWHSLGDLYIFYFGDFYSKHYLNEEKAT